MIDRRTNVFLASLGLVFAAGIVLNTSAAATLVLTNLAQIQFALGETPRTVCQLKLEGIVCAADGKTGAVILQDASGVELLELGQRAEAIRAGDKIRIESVRCLLRLRDLGIQLTAAPVVDNDGLHGTNETHGDVQLKAGQHPFRLEWFNSITDSELEATFEGPGISTLPLAGKYILRTADEAGTNTGALFGLQVECFEGRWDQLPDYDLYQPLRSGVVTNIGLGFVTRTDYVGLRFTGFFSAPRDGKYTFQLRSDDGSILFVGESNLIITRLGSSAPPPPRRVVVGESVKNLRAREWVEVQGRVSFVSSVSDGLEFELRSEPDAMRVKVANATGLNPATLLNARIRVVGAIEGVLTADQRMVMGSLSAVDGSEVEILEPAPRATELPALLTTSEQIRALRPEDAARGLPLRIRGVVTSANPSLYRGQSMQDDTSGIYVDLHAIPVSIAPSVGDFWEVRGHTGPGDFAPIVVAEALTFLGKGQMPEPLRPAWDQLNNGSLDVQWVELQGLVTSQRTNNLTLLLPGGTVEAAVYQQRESILRPVENSLVRIRGVLFAEWNMKTREVVPGKIQFRNASLNVDAMSVNDPLEAPLKTARELLRFDPQATGLLRIKVRGQVMSANHAEIFCADGKAGFRVLPADPVNFAAGDLVEAVGYPEIGGPTPLLRRAVVHKTGVDVLPDATPLAENDLLTETLDATRVRVQGKLLGLHVEKGATVLEMQSGLQAFLARLAPETPTVSELRVGSGLELTGVYVARSHKPDRAGDAFELLLTSVADIRVLSKPPWWTLKKLLAALGVLSVVLAGAMLWVFQLRRRVEAQTQTIREQIEQKATLEERGRIARELHDTLEQALAGISLQLDGFARTLGTLPAESARALDMARAMVRHGQEEARRTVRNLRTLALEKGDLTAALAQMANRAGENASTHIEVVVTGMRVPLSAKIESHLLRIGQEATTNALKHARAKDIRLVLHYERHAIALSIRDDGRGFDTELALPSEAGHFGLLGMKERAEKIGGTLNITSRSGAGTTVQVNVPLNTNSH